MVKIVSFINRKGGVGKTTITVNIGGYLSNVLNQKVLIIDMDPQASASSWLMTQPRYLNAVVEQPNAPRITVYQIFADAIFNQKLFDPTRGIHHGVVQDRMNRILIPNLDLIPAHMKLDDLEREIVNYIDLHSAILWENLQKYNLGQNYDYILIDCPPNMGSTSQNAIFASDAFIIPIIADEISVQGFPELVNSALNVLNIAERRRLDHKRPECAGLMVSHYRNTNACNDTLEKIRDLISQLQMDNKLSRKANLFNSAISYKTAIPDCQGAGEILTTSKKRSDSQTEFQTLAREFHEKLSDW